MFRLLKKNIKRVLFSARKLLGQEFVEFHHFPFNEMSPLPSGADKEMNMVCKFLEENKINYRITDGTILGLYRNNAFIPHDNDIDIDLLDVINSKYLISEMIKKHSYKVGRIVYYKGKVQQVAFYNKRNVTVDFIFWYTNDNYLYNYQERGYERKQETKYFNKLDVFNYKGNEYKIPGFIEDWLVFRYGSDWNVPKTYKGDW